MDCQADIAERARHAARFGTEVLVWIFIFLAIVGAPFAARAQSAQPAIPKAREVLVKARDYQMQFRAGNMDVIPEYIALLEAATKREPDSADLWYALGRAYLMEGARALLPGGNVADAMPAMQKGPAALKRALQINPDHADSLAQLGGVQALMASLMQAPVMAKQGVAQMNRAVELAPNSTRVRLTRAFLGLTLPDDLRDHAKEAEDLDFLIEDTYGSRSIDYVRLLRADLDFETGKTESARDAYQLVADTGSNAPSKEAKARLAALEKGGIALSDIKALRSAAGAQCAMCHGAQ
jgi:tetratricopeptide (TPR) repeat protein